MSHRLTALSHEARPHPTSDAGHGVADPQITHNFRPTGLQVRGSLGPCRGSIILQERLTGLRAAPLCTCLKGCAKGYRSPAG